jgi:outer membrane protease
MQHDVGTLRVSVLLAASCGGVLLLCAAVAQALQATDGPEAKFESDQFVSFSIRGSVGYLSGQTRDTVYFHPQYGVTYEANELNWDMGDLYMGGAVASLAFMDGLHLNTGYWMPLSKGSGTINNYDWLRTGADWTDWSESSADASGSRVWDINAALDMLSMSSFAVGGIMGYKTEFWSSNGRGGRYIYSSNPAQAAGTRNVTGTSTTATFVRYEQTVHIPYVGLNTRMTVYDLTLSAYGLLSPWVDVTDENHLSYPQAYFRETFSRGMFYGLGVNATYKFTFGLFLSAALDYQNISNLKGDVYVRGTTVEEEITKGASADQHLTYFSLSAGYAF